MTSGGSSDSYRLTVGDLGEEKTLTTGGAGDDDELVVMAGEQSRTRRWKPVRHSVSGGGADRGWYGAMYFLSGTVDLSSVQASVSRGEADVNGILADASDCEESEIYCWQHCIDASDLPCGPDYALCTHSGVVTLFPDR